jgi:hypothetical protein
MKARAGITAVCIAVGLTAAVAAGDAGKKDVQGVSVACQRTCPDAVRFPVEAAACVAEMTLCQTRLGLYDTYMSQLGVGVTRRSLPAAYVEVLQAFYPGAPLGNYRFGFSPRQPVVATTDCSMTYYTTQAYVDKVAAGSLSTPGEFKLLFHEIHHYRQCMQAGGRNQFAKLWFDQIPLDRLQTFDMHIIHDAMPMEGQAKTAQETVFAAVSESNRDSAGRLVPSLRVVLKRGTDTVGSTMTATAGTPLTLTAELSGGSQPVKSLWQLRYSTGVLVEIGARDSRTLSHTFSGTGSYELLFNAFQEGTGLRASQRVTTTVQQPRTITAPERSIGDNVALVKRTLNVTLRNTRASALTGTVCIGDASDSNRLGQAVTTSGGLASFQLAAGISVVVTATAPGYIGATRTLTTSSADSAVSITLTPGVGGAACR